MTAPTAVQQFARFATTVRRTETGLPPDRADQITSHIRDSVAVSLAAAADWSDDPVTAVVEGWGGPGRAGVLGRSGRFPAAHAALIGGTLAHALDFDDTHLPSVLHPSAAVVPAALAAAEMAGASGRELVQAVAVGDELACRAGMAGYDEELGNSIFFERGLHATAICGALGAAAAAALLWDLDDERVGHAIAIATSMGSGLLEANRTGGSVKRVHCGWAAHAGVAAAELAAAGLTGPPTALEGRFGFLAAFCGELADPAALTEGLGARWEIERLHIKPYPANHFTHAVIDAALELRKRGVDPAAIVSAELGVATPVLRTIAEPGALKAAPPSGYAARFSGPFTFAAALAGGGGLGLFLDDFSDDRATDPELLRVAARVRCVADPRCDEIFPRQFPAVARVKLAGGATEKVEVLTNRGGPQRPLSDAELRAKFRDCAERQLSGDAVERVDLLLDGLLDLSDVGELVQATDPAPAEVVP